MNNLPRSIHNTSRVQYDWELTWNKSKSSIFGSILATDNETNKSPPKMIYLSVLGAYWNEYGTHNAPG